jgi:CubicO group peptidase (beta-lactamase class C family)
MRFLIVVFLMALTVGRPCAVPLQQEIVARQIHAFLPSDSAGGVAVVLRLGGHTSFFNYGWADRVNEKRGTSDSLFNLASLRKVFEATLLARSVRDGDLKLEDPVAKYVSELPGGGDIRRATLGQVATHTSGLLLPQDHPPWPDWGYTLPEFIRTLNARKAKKELEPDGGWSTGDGRQGSMNWVSAASRARIRSINMPLIRWPWRRVESECPSLAQRSRGFGFQSEEASGTLCSATYCSVDKRA